MSWERDPLLAKAKLFFERAFSSEREDPIFGLWCSLGLELLGKAAISSISPALLAEPDRDQNNLLYALNLDVSSTSHKSISATQVFYLCQKLFPQFTVEDFKLANALLNRRNQELHTGAAAFNEYKTNQWLAGFYQICKSLCDAMFEELENVFGEEEAEIAVEVIAENKKEVLHRVKESIAAHRRVFEDKSTNEQEILRKQAEERGNELAYKRHHRVNCPACGCVATVQGNPFGKETIYPENDSIIVRQAVAPNLFECSACSLRFAGYAELKAANLGDQITRRTTFTPAEFYGLIDQDELDEHIQKGIDEYVDNEMDRYPEYDNEQ